MTTIINANSSGLVETVDTSGNLQFQTNGAAALHINNSQNITANSTGAITLNVGNTAQRPTAANGMIRYSNTTNVIEAYVNGTWANVITGNARTLTAYDVAITVVAGGGGGGGYVGGGGGAGGVQYFSFYGLIPGTTYTANIGAGGAGATNSQTTPASNGGNSVFGSGSTARIVSIGGGGGGTLNQRPAWKGSLGGSGGGDGGQNNEGLYGSYGPGIPGQGFDGGFTTTGTAFCGGGGAGAIGANGASTASGGVGILNPIAGSTAGQLISGNYWLAGGGGAGSTTTSTGGNGGGGNTGVNGTVNTGGGGGASYNSTGGNGGSGVIVMSIPLANYPGNANVTGTYTYANTGTAIVLGFTANTTYIA
jgi:hypothetical protein